MIQRNKYVHRRTSIQAFTLQEILEVGETFVIQAYVEIKKLTFPLSSFMRNENIQHLKQVKLILH
jgi:hypothetical protein